jgi:hypothetical protein
MIDNSQFWLTEISIQRLHEHGKVWRRFEHPNVAHFYGLAFNCGNMPALILTFYSNGNIMEYLKASDASKLILVYIFYFPAFALVLSEIHTLTDSRNRSWTAVFT